MSEITFTPAVVGFLVKDGQILLGLRKKVSFGLGGNLISGIGGKVGDSPEIANETPNEALVREFIEEIQVTPTWFQDLGQVKFIFPDKPKWNQTVRIYIITQWTGEPSETEAIKPLWFKQANLPISRMWPDNAVWLPRILSGERVDLTFLLANDGSILETLDATDE